MTIQQKQDAVLRFLFCNHSEYHIKWGITEQLTKLFPELAQDNGFILELDDILKDFSRSDFVIIGEQKIRPASKPGERVEMINKPSYKISSNGIIAAKNISDAYILTHILDEEGKLDAVFSMILKHINAESVYGASHQIQAAITNLYKEMPRQIAVALDSALHTPYIEKKFGSLGFLKMKGKDKYGERNFKFNKRGKRLIAFGSLEAFQEWETQQFLLAQNREILSDKLLERSVATSEIQESLLSINRWIALGGIVVAIQAAFSLFDYYEKHSLDFQKLAYFLSGIVLSYTLWLLRSAIKRLLSKRKP